MFALQKLAPVAVLLALGLSSLRCAATTPDADDPSVARVDDSDRVLQYRTTLHELRGHAYAKYAAPDLDLAESWLGDAEAQLRTEAPDKERVSLLLEAVRGQLVKVRSFYGRREAESALQQVKADYQQRKERIQQLRDTEDEQ